MAVTRVRQVSRACAIYMLLSATALVVLLSIQHSLTTSPKRIYSEKNESNTDSSQRNVSVYLKPTSFTASGDRKIFIFGAVVRNSSDTAEWDMCNIYGEWYYRNAKFVWCCLKYTDGTVLDTNIVYKGTTWHSKEPAHKIPLQPFYVTCENPFSFKVAKVEWVSVVQGPRKCSHSSTKYHKAFYPLRQKPGHLVLTTKTAHAQLSPALIATQLELLKHIGVDKVITYVENTLWDSARKVFDYYAASEFLEIFDYHLADVEALPREIISQNRQVYADQVTVMRDAVERSSGSTYFGIIDNDEFFFIRNNMTLKNVLETMRQNYPNISSLVFKNQHFFTNVKKSTCTTDCLFFNEYSYSSDKKKFNLIHRKVISDPMRIYTGDMTTHDIHPRERFLVVVCPENLAFILHYGRCERKFKRGDICTNRKDWVVDASAETWIENTVAKKARATLKLLELM